MEQKIVNGAAGASHVIGSPLTNAVTRETAPDLLLNDIDSRIVKVRPMATPIDQISRAGTSRNCKSMIAEYYSVDTVPTSSAVSEAVAGNYSKPSGASKSTMRQYSASPKHCCFPTCPTATASTTAYAM